MVKSGAAGVKAAFRAVKEPPTEEYAGRICTVG
jgi:hypothetical protein